ncbi:hypothetical protein J4N42_06460 [Vibrio sp. SCSIO 43135]|uniref:hypothetical protein n=1 Tax=Vibrio sp. SCSIO 43135 TaxID=2819096 RepID=UPI0020762F1A|nr:hypothetical protein [Vibrio sp. SCSIO 43135]USD42356.1 hypothetical protein J4N42_06460 [Vibrio sp. SCSIO 43135]
MDCQQQLYNLYFKAQDRFLYQYLERGFEPDVIYDYIHSGMMLSSLYETGAEHESPLLCELYLRQVYFHLLDAIQDPKRSHTFRRVCLDSVYTPLMCLKRHYYQQEDGDAKFLPLQLQLQRIKAPY